MTDIHSHVIPFVDDGSNSLEASLGMLREEIAQGVETVVCTPHLRTGYFEKSDETVLENFNLLKKSAEESGLKINLYLGREVFYKHSLFMKLLEEKTMPTINGGKYALVEFDVINDPDIDEVCYSMSVAGYIPVIAHIERYTYFRSVEAVQKLKRYGTLISVNAEPIVSGPFGAEHIFVKKLLKHKLVDLVGSDVHYNRKNYMNKAYLRVAKSDRAYADAIFGKNAEKVLFGK